MKFKAYYKTVAILGEIKMHHHLEIIMPETKDVDNAIEKILAPFDENNEDTDHHFFDWYMIGGRWTGEKLTARYSKEAMELFYKDLKDKKITVSGLQCGKQEISPKEQIPLVDEIWQKHFPDGGPICPIFNHFGDAGKSFDICSIKDIPEHLTAERVIISPDGESAEFMIEKSFWNGVDHVDTKWDTRVLSALELYLKRISKYREEHKTEVTPNENWICVTVDYHS